MDHRLAAILIADIAGYTRLVELDSEGTVAAWKLARTDAIAPGLRNHDGRLVKLTGDGFLAEFTSIQNAVKSAIEIQERLTANPLDFRIAVNLGDVIDDGDDLHGEGVNIAARIEALAEPGGVFVSRGVFEQVRHRIDCSFDDLGSHRVKHVSEPVHVFAVRHLRPGTEQGLRPKTSTPRSDAAKASRIAMWPVEVRGNDDDLKVLAEGLDVAVLDGLSKCPALVVTEVGSGSANFELRGNLRRAGSRLRATFSLMDVAANEQIWSDRYERTIEDVFDLEDEIAQALVYVVRIRLKDKEGASLATVDNAELSGPELLTKAAGFLVHGVKEIDTAKACVEAALEKIPHSAMAQSMFAASLYIECEKTPLALPAETAERIFQFAERASASSEAKFFEPLLRAICEMDLRQDLEAARAHVTIALRHNPQFLPAQILHLIICCHSGELADAHGRLRQAIFANRRDSHDYRHARELAVVTLIAGDAKEAAAVLGENIARTPACQRNRLVQAGCLEMAGEHDRAATIIGSLLTAFPNLSTETMRPTYIGIPEVKGRFLQALENAGLPQHPRVDGIP